MHSTDKIDYECLQRRDILLDIRRWLCHSLMNTEIPYVSMVVLRLNFNLESMEKAALSDLGVNDMIISRRNHLLSSALCVVIIGQRAVCRKGRWLTVHRTRKSRRFVKVEHYTHSIGSIYNHPGGSQHRLQTGVEQREIEEVIDVFRICKIEYHIPQSVLKLRREFPDIRSIANYSIM